MIEIRPLTAQFAFQITGARPDRLPTPDEIAEIKRVFADRSVLVFRDMAVSDEQQRIQTEASQAMERLGH